MAKKKDDKNNKEHKVQKADAQKLSHSPSSRPPSISEDTISKILRDSTGYFDTNYFDKNYFATHRLSEDTIKEIFSLSALEYPKTTLSPSGQIRLSIPSSRSYISLTPREQELEDEITKLKRANAELLKEIGTKDETEQRTGKEIEVLKNNIEELKKKQRLQHLLDRVNENAREKLLESQKFRDLFEKSESCNAVIISVDIRRSTELMLKAREPQLYADFITSLCVKLTNIILGNYGVFDKFTGDGILAFFPEFYSGQDSSYWALKAAYECHNCFLTHYRAKRSCFKSILIDVGLGIGIDYGMSHLVKIQDGLTVIGTPVVYACRLSGAQAGQTLLNQAAYEVTSEKFGQYVDFQETEIDIKHEGRTLAYVATLSEKTYEPKSPDWLSPSISPDK